MSEADYLREELGMASGAEMLSHHSTEPVTFDPDRTYDQHEPHGYLKPNGLWVSVDGPDDWVWWNRSEREDTEFPAHSYRVTLAQTATLLRIGTGEELEAFHEAYSIEDDHSRALQDNPTLSATLDYAGNPKMSFAFRQRPMDWETVTKEFDGLIVAPYLWSHRLIGPSWYYGFDCASGCIWNLSAVAEFTEIPPQRHVCVQ